MRSMSKYNSQIISPEYSLLAGKAANKVSFLKSLLQTAPNDPPIKFEKPTAPIFMKWIVSLRKDYLLGNVTMLQELKKEVSNHFRGLKRKVASVIAASGGNIKDLLAFS